MNLINKICTVSAFCMLAVLSGCVTPQPRPNYHSSAEVRTELEQLRTTKPEEVQRRWGDFARMADKAWMYKPGAGNDRYGMDFKWIVPGSVMDITFAWCNLPNCKKSWTVQYNANLNHLYFIGENGALDKVGVVQQDGSVNVSDNGFYLNLQVWKYDALAKTFTLNAGTLSTYTYSEVPREELVAVLNTHFKPTPPTASNTKVASEKNAAASALPIASANQPGVKVKPTKAQQGKASAVPASNDPGQQTNSSNVRKLPNASKPAIARPNFGPFEEAIGNIYAVKEGSTIFKIIKTADGSMAIRTESFYDGSTNESEIPPISVEGVPKQEKCILYFTSDCTVILLPDGVLRREQSLTLQETKYRFVSEYRLAESSLISTTQYVRISGEGNSVLEEKKTQTLERVTPSDIQAIQDSGRQLAQKNARRMAELEAETARNKANAKEWDEHFDQVERQQRNSAANTFANIANAVQQDRNRMRNMERQMQSSTRQAIASAERTYSAPTPAAQPARQPSPEPAPQRTRESSTYTPPARMAANDASSAGKAAVGAREAEKTAAPSLGKAKAWCMKKKSGEFLCNGPLQNGGWGSTVKAALGMVDCSNGSGYTPTVGTGGQSFDCGRNLKSSEQTMPTYDPFHDRDK